MLQVFCYKQTVTWFAISRCKLIFKDFLLVVKEY